MLGFFADSGLLADAADALARPFADDAVTKVAGIEARGFVLATAVALRLGSGFVAIQKPGAIHPGAKAEVRTDPDWRGRELALRLQRDAISAGDRVLVVDDWAETGSQARAARQLIEQCGGVYAGLSLLVDQLALETRAQLAPVAAVATAADIGA